MLKCYDRKNRTAGLMHVLTDLHCNNIKLSSGGKVTNSDRISDCNSSPHSEIAVKVNNLSKSYKVFRSPVGRIKELLHPFDKKYHRDFWALKDINLEIPKGTTFGIIGRNGSGKSTLLQLIAGILRPTEGHVAVNGRVSALLELRTGFSPQFTGRENIHLKGTIMGLSRDEIRERVDDIVAFADIGDFIDQPVKTYSSGMYVRLAFAVAINVSPDILLVDETLAVGDTYFQAKCLKKFEEFQEKGITIIFVSHDTNAIKNNCREVLLLDQGKMIDKGEPKEIVDVYNAITFEKIASEIKGDVGLPAADIAAQRLAGQRQRYGTSEAAIIDAAILNSNKVRVENLISGEQSCIRIKTLFKSRLEKVSVGITIRNRIGIDVYMVNTEWKAIDISAVKENEVLVVDFNQSMSLGAGGYLVNVAVVQSVPEGMRRLDWVSDMIAFNVLASDDFSGICNLNSSISVWTVGTHEVEE